jgi:hypothetical protein
MRALAAAAATLAMLSCGVATSAAYVGTRTTDCGVQPPGVFSLPPFGDADDVRFGPLVFANLKRARLTTPANTERHGGWKSPVYIRWGHSVTVSIDPSARSFARMGYVHLRNGNGLAFRDAPHTVRFVSCHRRRAARNGRIPQTFWSGFFMLQRSPACVPISVTIDGRRRRHRTIPIAQRSCASTPPAKAR